MACMCPHGKATLKKHYNLGGVVTIEGDACVITKNNVVLAKGRLDSDLYRLDCKEAANLVNHANCIHLWHNGWIIGTQGREETLERKVG